MKNIPKSQWEAFVLKKHPNVLEVKERVRPLTSENSFSRNISIAKTENKHSLSYDTVLQLIMEYLDYEGYAHLIKHIEDESNVKCKFYLLQYLTL
jgi:hypothetical protein